MKELVEVLSSVRRGAALGPDGFRAAFFVFFRPHLPPSLLHVVNICLETQIAPPSFSGGCVVLVLNGGRDSTDPSSWRLITRVNVHRKLVASVFISRMRSLLPRLVSAQPCRSVPRRSLFFALALTRGLLQYAAHTHFRSLFVSLDQSPAFDRSEHEFLFAVVRAQGFPCAVLSSLKALYTGLGSSLLVNGVPTVPFAVSRCVRQG